MIPHLTLTTAEIRAGKGAWSPPKPDKETLAKRARNKARLEWENAHLDSPGTAIEADARKHFHALQAAYDAGDYEGVLAHTGRET